MTSHDPFVPHRIGDLAEVFDGPHATPRKVDQGPWYLNIASLKNGRLDLSESAHIHADDVAKWTARVKPKRGDTLFSYETRLGESAFWDRNDEAVLGRRMGLLRPREDKVDPRFLAYAYLSDQFQEAIRIGTLHGATVNRIPVGDLPNWEIMVPSLPEQRRIAGVLGAFDDLIETNQGMITTMEQLMQGLFQRGQFDRPLNGEPSTTIGLLVEVNPPVAKPRGEAPYVEMAMLPTNGALLPPPGSRPAQGGARFSNGDALLARITPCLENGKTAYVTNLRAGEVGVGSTEFIVLRGRGGTKGIWAYCLARSARFRTFAIQQLGDGTSGRQRLSADAVADYRLAIPDDVELARFQAETQPLVEGMVGLHEEALKLTRQRDELLPLLMSGRVRVAEVEGAA